MCLTQSQVGNAAQVGRLLDVLPRRGPRAFNSLVEALRDTGQEHAADLLTESVDSQQLGASHNSRSSDGNSNILLCSDLVTSGIVYRAGLVQWPGVHLSVLSSGHHTPL